MEWIKPNKIATKAASSNPYSSLVFKIIFGLNFKFSILKIINFISSKNKELKKFSFGLEFKLFLDIVFKGFFFFNFLLYK